MRQAFTVAERPHPSPTVTDKALSTLLVGVGIKLSLYDPLAAADTPRAAQHRWLLGGAVVSCLTLHLVMGPLHTGILVRPRGLHP